MFDRLIASRTHFPDRPLAPSGTVAVLAHAAVCAAWVLATLHPQRVVDAAGPPIVISWPQPAEHRSHGDPLDGIPGPAEPTWDLSRLPPIGLPSIDEPVPFDPRVPLRGGGDDLRVNGVADGPWSSTAVDAAPALLAGPPLAYPDVLRRAGIQGTVVVQARQTLEETAWLLAGAVALGLLALCRILFGRLGGHGSGRSNFRRRLDERCDHMTPEEREQFRQRMRERFGFGPSTSETKEH